MKQHRIICIPTLTFALLLMFTPSILQAQDKPVFPIDSLITVGYATGNKKNISGSVEKITELGMNKDQITNPLEAIRGRVPGLTIQKGTNGPAALDAVRLRGTTSLTSCLLYTSLACSRFDDSNSWYESAVCHSHTSPDGTRKRNFSVFR